MSDIEHILSRLHRVRRSGRRWMAGCPAHPDKTPSLAIGLGEEGRVLVHCHAACRTEDVLAAIGLTWADLFPNGPRRPMPKPIRSVSRPLEGATAVGIFLPSTDWPDRDAFAAELRLGRAERRGF